MLLGRAPKKKFVPEYVVRLRRVSALTSRILVASAAICTAALFCRYMRDCPWVYVNAIGVHGVQRLSEADIVAASGITTGDHILLVDPDDVDTRVTALPYVETCTVQRMFPDTVLIDVEERVPVAVVLVHNQAYEVDADRVVLRQLAAEADFPGPMITEVPGLGSIEPGQVLAQKEVEHALNVWYAFRDVAAVHGLTVSEIAARNLNDIRVYCDELLYELRWGRGGHNSRETFERQAQRLDTLWRQKGMDLDCREYLELRLGWDLACR